MGSWAARELHLLFLELGFLKVSRRQAPTRRSNFGASNVYANWKSSAIMGAAGSVQKAAGTRQQRYKHTHAHKSVREIYVRRYLYFINNRLKWLLMTLPEHLHIHIYV